MKKPVTFRLFTESDIKALVKFWNANVPFDRLTPALLREKTVEDADFSPELTLVVERRGKLVGFMQGILRTFGDERVGWLKLFAVDRDYRRQGIATELADRIEGLLKERGAGTLRVVDSNPNYLQPGIDPRYTEAIAFLERRGYQRFADTVNLEADLRSQSFGTSGEERRLKAQGFDIRRATPEDAGAVRDFLGRHFAAWIPEVSNTFSNRPISLHLALRGGEIVAFSAHEGNNRGTGWFGPMGTAPEHRGHGLGGVLLLRCLRDLKRQGYRVAVIPWVGPIAFYLHYCGAKVTRVFWRYAKKVA